MLITRGAGELASAQRIQAALLPGDEQVMGFEIAGRCRFAHEVGGDHIFVRKCGPGHLQLGSQRELTPEERDVVRAQLIRDTLSRN